MPHLLAPYGYTSACLGKLHMLPHANRNHREVHPAYGFDQLEVSDEPGVYEDAYRAWVKIQDSSQLEHLSIGLPPARKVWQETLNAPDPVPHPERGPLSGERDDFSGPIPSPIPEGLTHSTYLQPPTSKLLPQKLLGLTLRHVQHGCSAPQRLW